MPVSQHKNASAYHKFAWLEAVKAAYGHSMLGVIATCANTGQVVGVFPAVLMNIPLRVSYTHLTLPTKA